MNEIRSSWGLDWKLKPGRWVRRVAALAVLATAPVFPGGVAGESDPGVGGTFDLDPYTVVGSKESLHTLPGSGYFVDERAISLHDYDSIEQIMRRVPGVYFRTEDGFGLFPNISFRGVGSMRTTKLTVMEDGVLAAPAPYSNPSAYYTPTTGRMSGVEILKGSSQVRFGPHTTGGVLNYLSTPIPDRRAGNARVSYGTNGDIRFHGHLTEVAATEAGVLGILFEHYYRRNNGFKELDVSETFGGAETGFRKSEPMLKVSWAPSGPLKQAVELKVGYTDLEANETYLGLSGEDFRLDPYRRYVAGRFDRIPMEQWRSYLRHRVDLGDQTRLLSTVYYNQFSRAWYKLHDIRRPGGEVAGLSLALAGGPFLDSAGEPVAGTEGDPLAVLRGEAAGTWRVRDNNRTYASYGAESILRHGADIGFTHHSIELGVRVHEDYEDRFQHQDDYAVDGLGNVTSVTMRAPGSQDSRRGTARALAIHLNDRMERERWSVTPGIRFEHIRYTDQRRQTDPAAPDFNQVIREEKGTLNVVAPGIGVHYDATERWALFGGVHRGFSLPSPSAALSPGNPVGEETSIGYEAGVRYRDIGGGLRAEWVLFLTNFEDLIVPDNIGGAGTGVTENAGDVRTYGLETALSYDPGVRHNWGFRMPMQLALTLTDATIRSDVSAAGDSGGAVESIFAGGRRGNRLPYVPRCQVSMGMGVDFDRFGIFLDGFYVASTYASANNESDEMNPFAGPGHTPLPDARFGRNDPFFLLDASALYRFTERATLHLSVQNFLDRVYMASRLPHGPRPGHPRSISAGVSLEF